MIHRAVIFALLAVLPNTMGFCPDGCACDEDLLHVTCLRSKLEVRLLLALIRIIDSGKGEKWEYGKETMRF